MKTHYILPALLFLTCCSSERGNGDGAFRRRAEQQLIDLTRQLTEAEISDHVPAFLKHYDTSAISMPEYQLALSGVDAVGAYYREIFKRQRVKSFQRLAEEFIHLDTVIVEIGTFQKEFHHSQEERLTTLRGKYWHIWKRRSGGVFKLKGEAYGYFSPVADPENFVVQLTRDQPDESDILIERGVPFELKAYNALMEKGVRTRDGILRSSFFTGDARLFPFADSTVTGIEKIKPYLIAYSSGGIVRIDSVRCYTYDFTYSGDYILEFDMFKVRWSTPDRSGRTEGKGIRIWQRQGDNSLRLYREIGTHNLLQ